jgi:single-strand DNA-binding protein
MNKSIIIGRLTKDPEIKYSSGNDPIAYGNYTIAVDRPTKKDADKVTDFIYCKVVGKTAEFAEKYLKKGIKIAVEGRIQVDQWEDAEGNKKSTTYLQVLQHEFCESKSADSSESASADNDDFAPMEAPDDMPF